jgi:flagellar motor switch protein FliM
MTIRDLTNAQIEMKGLIDQERAIYNDERERLEEDVKRANIVAEAKIRLIKTRLLSLYEGDFEEISRELPVEELIERIA